MSHEEVIQILTEMQIVIDIPEETYKGVMLGKWDGSGLSYFVKTGTILPKGHGRLIDADALYNDLEFPSKRFGEAFKEILDDAPTIIEAYKEVEE